MPGGAHQHVNHAALITAIRDYMAVRGAWYMKVPGGLGVRAGSPDCLACLRGRFIAIEAKTGRATLTASQMRERTRLEGAGALYVEVHTVDDLEDALYDGGLIADKALMRFGEVTA